MVIGRKMGGRLAVTPNRTTRKTRALLDSLGHNPIDGSHFGQNDRAEAASAASGHSGC
jgi:hypothetical protein